MSYYNLPKFKAFRFWCQKVLPLVYDDSLSYYEVLSKVVHGLNLQADVINEIEDILEGSGIDIDEAVDKVIDKLEDEGILETEVENAIAQAISDGDIDERCEYVVNQMISGGDFDNYVDGQIGDYITGGSADNYIEGLISAETANKIKQYNTFADIPTSGLTIGEIISTRGFYNVGDKGGAIYQVKRLDLNQFPSNSGYCFYIMDEVTPKKCGSRNSEQYDDSTIINSMLTTYNRINLKDYSYYLDHTITVRYNNTIIHGEGATITRRDYNNEPAITSTNKNNVTIDGINFYDGVQQTASVMLSLIRGENVCVRNCRFYNVFGYCIRFNSNTISCIEDCYFQSITGATGNPGGAVYEQGGFRNTFRNLKGYDLSDHLVYLDGSVEISEVNIDNCMAWNIYADTLTNAAVIAIYGEVNECNISNLTVRSWRTGIGLFPRDSGMPKNITINNCTFRNISEEGIIAEGTGSQAGLAISNCTFYAITQDGISLRTLSECTISNCIFESVTRNGVESRGSSNITITGCIFRNCNVGILHGVDSATNHVIISSCAFINGVNGVYLRSGSDALIVGLLFLGTFTSSAISSLMSNVQAIGVPIEGSVGKSIYWGTQAPSSGMYRVGDIVLDSTGTTKGWKCTVSGAPGTWTAIS